MKSIVIKLLIFVGLFIGLDFLAGLVVGHFYKTSKNINLEDANYGFLGDVQNDILILGASELSHALITNKISDETGLSTYNLACDACGVYYQYPLLETILEKHTPKAIILSSGQMNDENLRYVSKLYPFYRRNDHVKQMVDILYPKEYLKLAFYGYVYNSNLIRIFDGKDDNLNGYVPLLPEESTLANIKLDVLPEGKDHELSEQTVSYFKKVIERSSSAGAKVYVCIPPMPQKINEDYWNKMKAVITGTEAELIDFSHDSTMIHEGKYFYDRSHLNDDGAEVMTDSVLAILKADGIY